MNTISTKSVAETYYQQKIDSMLKQFLYSSTNSSSGQIVLPKDPYQNGKYGNFFSLRVHRIPYDYMNKNATPFFVEAS